MSNIRACKLDLKLIDIKGTDRLSYLHGQLTQDLNQISTSCFKWAGHCSPKGKLWGVFRLYSHNDKYSLLGSHAEVDASIKELKKYGVFAQVDININDNVDVFGIITDNHTGLFTALGIDPIDNANAFEFNGNKGLKLSANRYILIVEKGQNLPFEIVDSNIAFTTCTILQGEPQLAQEYIEEFVPQMLNLQALGGISFKKGCYTGQETVARMKYLGKNKRAMFAVKGYSKFPIDEYDLELQLGDNWRRAGKVIHQSYDKNSHLYFALAVLPLDIKQSDKLRAKNFPKVGLEISPLPYSLDEQ